VGEGSRAADLGEDAVEAEVDGGVGGLGVGGTIAATGWLDQAGGGQGLEARRVGGIQRAELGDGAAVDGDDHPLAGAGLAQRSGQVRSQLPDPDLLHPIQRTRAYTSLLALADGRG